MPSTRFPTWIVVADGGSARVIALDARNAAPGVVHELAADLPGHARDLKSAAPGRAFTAGTSERHAMEPRTDPLVHEKRQFARRVAALVNEAAQARRFARLVLVAPPKTLGDLRAALAPEAARLVGGEIPHDHVHARPDEIVERLGDTL